jgi:hypothetical protein
MFVAKLKYGLARKDIKRIKKVVKINVVFFIFFVDTLYARNIIARKSAD